METHLQQNSNLISYFKGSEYKVDCLARNDPSHSQDYTGIILDRYKLHSRKAPGNVGYIYKRTREKNDLLQKWH